MEKFKVVFEKQAAKDICELKKLTNCSSVTKVVQDAVSLYKWAVEQTLEGRSIACVEKDKVRSFVKII